MHSRSLGPGRMKEQDTHHARKWKSPTWGWAQTIKKCSSLHLLSTSQFFKEHTYIQVQGSHLQRRSMSLTADSTIEHQSVWGRKGRRRERSPAAYINPQAQHNHSSNRHHLLFTLDMDFHCISSSYQSQELGLLLSPFGGCQIWGWVRLTNCLRLHG